MKATRRAVAAVALLGLLEAGCLVHVTHVSDPGNAFARARDEAERDGARRGQPSHLNLLAWDPKDREMVRISVPLWLLENIDVDGDDFGGEDHERWRRRMGRVRWQDIARSAPGILLEVTEDEGERVLVWLR